MVRPSDFVCSHQQKNVLLFPHPGQKGYGKKIAVLLNVSKAKFRKPVVPGDVLFLQIYGKYISAKGGKIEGKGLVDSKVVVEAELPSVYSANVSISFREYTK